MKKIMKKIEKSLKGLSTDEKNEILDYYQEIINDRIDQNESIESIDESINYSEIRKLYIPKTINSRKKDTVKQSTRSSNTLLLYLLSSPIWIPLGIVYLAVLIVIYALIFSFYLVMAILPLALILMPIDFAIRKQPFGDTLIVTGALLMGTVLIEALLYYLNKSLLKLNNLMIRLFSKVISRKDA